MSDTLRVRCPNCNATGQEHVRSGEMYAGAVTCKLCNGKRHVTVRMSDTPEPHEVPPPLPNELCPACWGDGVVEGEQRTRERMCLCEGGPGPHGEFPCSRCGGSAVIVELLDPLMLCPVCEGTGEAK